MWQRWDFIGTGDIETSLRDKTEEQLIIDQSTPSGSLYDKMSSRESGLATGRLDDTYNYERERETLPWQIVGYMGILTEGQITCMIVSTKAKKPTLSTNIKEQDRKLALKQTNLTIRRTICQETICFIEPMYTNLPFDLMSTGHNQMIILFKNR